MGFLIFVVIIVVVVIVVKVLIGQAKDREYNELKERIHNSSIIIDLSEQIQAISYLSEYNWIQQQTNYYDECKRGIFIFNDSIQFAVWQNNDWQFMLSIGFIETLGYKPLLDNGLQYGKKHITNQDIFRAFTEEVSEIVKNLFHNDLKFEYSIKYSNGYESQRQPDGTSKMVKVGDEQASIRYKVPKSVGAKQI